MKEKTETRYPDAERFPEPKASAMYDICERRHWLFGLYDSIGTPFEGPLHPTVFTPYERGKALYNGVVVGGLTKEEVERARSLPEKSKGPEYRDAPLIRLTLEYQEFESDYKRGMYNRYENAEKIPEMKLKEFLYKAKELGFSEGEVIPSLQPDKYVDEFLRKRPDLQERYPKIKPPEAEKGSRNPVRVLREYADYRKLLSEAKQAGKEAAGWDVFFLEGNYGSCRKLEEKLDASGLSSERKGKILSAFQKSYEKNTMSIMRDAVQKDGPLDADGLIGQRWRSMNLSFLHNLDPTLYPCRTVSTPFEAVLQAEMNVEKSFAKENGISSMHFEGIICGTEKRFEDQRIWRAEKAEHDREEALKREFKNEKEPEHEKEERADLDIQLFEAKVEGLEEGALSGAKVEPDMAAVGT